MTITITILGCGSSGGVPRVGNQWGACNPDNPKNRRLRCSILVQKTGNNGAQTTVLIDTSPDMRAQLLKANVTKLDAVLYTHSHADHCHGLDDIRPLMQQNKARVPAFADEFTRRDLMEKFGYCFETPAGSSYPPIMDMNLIEHFQELTVNGAGGALTFLPLPVQHGEAGNPREQALGFRFEDVVYIPDVNFISEESAEHMKGLKYFIIDALRYTYHNSHFTVDEALEWVARLKPERAILTNLNIELDYDELGARLPQQCTPAFDGMVLRR